MMTGFGAMRGEEVGVIEAQRQRVRRALLGVLGQFVLQVAAERGDEASRRGHRPARLDAAQPRRHRAAAGVAGDADVLRIDLRARQQVIERADAVPGPPASEELADEELLIAREQMFADADARPVILLDVAVLQRSPWPIGSKMSTT